MTSNKQRILLALLVVALVAAAVGGYLLARPDSADGPGSTTTWNSYDVTSDGLAIYKTVRPCDEPVRAVVRETSDRIEVALAVDFGGVCAALAVDKSVVVELRDPLDRRPVHDAACLDGERPERECLRDRRAS